MAMDTWEGAQADDSAARNLSGRPDEWLDRREAGRKERV